MKTVIVCGASSGLGLGVAKALAAAGYTVYAGARSYPEVPDLMDGLHRRYLDVTCQDSADAFYRWFDENETRLDALVSCAGILTLGSCEETTHEEVERVLSVNTLGALRMVRPALRRMRAQGGGRILQLSSINGVLGIPFQSAYTLSKHALEGYFECLRMEMKPFGVQVGLLEPGDHRGGSAKYRAHARAMNDASPYARAYQSAIDTIDHDEKNGDSPDDLGRFAVKLLQKKHMPLRAVRASFDQRLAVVLHRLLPGALFQDMVINPYYRKRMKVKA